MWPGAANSISAHGAGSYGARDGASWYKRFPSGSSGYGDQTATPTGRPRHTGAMELIGSPPTTGRVRTPERSSKPTQRLIQSGLRRSKRLDPSCTSRKLQSPEGSNRDPGTRSAGTRATATAYGCTPQGADDSRPTAGKLQLPAQT